MKDFVDGFLVNQVSTFFENVVIRNAKVGFYSICKVIHFPYVAFPVFPIFSRLSDRSLHRED